MGWAADHWIILEGRAIKDGVLVGGLSFLDYPPMQFLSYVEYILREDEDANDHLDRLYEIQTLDPVEDRRRAIMEAMAAFGGD